MAGSPGAGGATGAAPPLVPCRTELPALTWPRSAAASGRLTLPFTCSDEARCHFLTFLVVTGPYWPSIVVRTPTFPKNCWSTRTS